MVKDVTTPANDFPQQVMQVAENLKTGQVQLNKMLHKMASKQARINTHLSLVRQDVEDVHDMFYDAFRLTGEVNCVTLVNMLRVEKRREQNVPHAPKKLVNSPKYVTVTVDTNTDSQLVLPPCVQPHQPAYDDCPSPKSCGSTQGKEAVARRLLDEFTQAENSTTEANESLCQSPPSGQPPIKPASPEVPAKQFKFSKLHKRGKQAVPIKDGDSVENVSIKGSPIPVKRLRLETQTTSTPAKPETVDIEKSPAKNIEQTPPVSPIVASDEDTRTVLLVSSPEEDRFAALTKACNEAKKAGKRLNRQFNRNGK